MNKKFELIKNDSIEINGHKLYRLRALINFNDVKAGDLGGYVESKKNLAQMDDCWIYDDAKVYGKANVFDNARVFGNACVCDAWVFDKARVYGNAKVYGSARVSGNAKVYGSARVSGNVDVFHNAHVCGNARIFGNTRVHDDAWISGNACVCDNACVHGSAHISGDAIIKKYNDYIVFANTWSSSGIYTWSSGRYFTYTKSNKMWKVGCFYGTGDELIQKAYAESENKGKHYELYVNLVKEMEQMEK